MLGVAAIVTLGAGFLIQTASNVVDFDTWHQIAAARDILSGRGFPHTDPYAFTETFPQPVHHEWGAGLITYALATRLGPNSILVLKYLLLGAVAALGFAVASARSGPIADWGLIAVPAIPLISIGFTHAFRAQMFTYLFVMALFALLRLDETGKRWWIPLWLLAFPVWVNLHGGCAVGVILMIVAAGERAIAKGPFAHLLLAAAGMFALLAVNPYGLAYYQYLWRALLMPRPHITEWLPMWTSGSVLGVFAVCVLTAGIGISENGWRGRPGLGILAATGIAALGSLKMAPVFGLAWLCCGPALLRNTPLRRDIETQNRTAPGRPILCWLVILGIFAAFGGMREWKLRVPGEFIRSIEFPPYPVGAVQYLAGQKFAGNVLAPFEFGAYVTWKLAPHAKVFVDSRYEAVYPERLVDDVFRFYSAGPGWQAILSGYPIDFVLVPASTAIAAAMPGSGWNRVYNDPQYAVYSRPGLALQVRSADVAPDGSLP